MPRRAILVSLAVLVIALFSVPAPLSVAAAPPESTAYVPGELLVKFRPSADSKAITDAHRSIGGSVKRTISRIGVEVVSVQRGREKTKLAEYLRNPNVEFAELNGIYRAVAMPSDPRVGEQWQYENTGQTGGTPDAGIDAF
ncbi:MAG TPA: hypothetical protein PKA95_00630, partial [Thermomicrobiales bacterium]|nr:hypothetical protein [Thermomicrobiales bacterium]